MKNILYKVLPLFLLFLTACKKDTVYILPESIVVGEKTGKGIDYVNIEPDIICPLPLTTGDTTIKLDVNRDGVDDFMFYRWTSNPLMMGYSKDEITFIPLTDGGIRVIPTKYPDPVIEPCMHSSLDWVDTLTHSDTLTPVSYWTKDECLIHCSTLSVDACYLAEGCWTHVTHENEKYIGFMLIKENRCFIGWIGLYSNADHNRFIITDYAITKEYCE